LIPNQQVRRRPAASPRQPIVLLRRTLPAATPYPASRLIQAQIMNSSTLQRTHQGIIMSSSCLWMSMSLQMIPLLHVALRQSTCNPARRYNAVQM
jgi:hypothetical protein